VRSEAGGGLAIERDGGGEFAGCAFVGDDDGAFAIGAVFVDGPYESPSGTWAIQAIRSAVQSVCFAYENQD